MFDVIALDLDGTLLKNDKTVSTETLQALKEHEKIGKQIVIATARPPRLEPIKLPEDLQREFMIFYNGAEIYHNKEKIYSASISVGSANKIKNLILQEYNQCKIGFEIDNKLYTPTKILLDMSSIDNSDSFKLKLPPDCNLVITDNCKLGQIMAHGVNKLCALKYILDKLDTTLDKVMFFGDDTNDIELIKACGIGVAMGNADANVKEIADYVTTSNEEDGIAVFLKRYLKNINL